MVNNIISECNKLVKKKKKEYKIRHDKVGKRIHSFRNRKVDKFADFLLLVFLLLVLSLLFTSLEFFTSVLADGFSLEFE